MAIMDCHGHEDVYEMESVQRPQSSKQSKRPEDQAPAVPSGRPPPAGGAPTGKPVTGSAAGFIAMFLSAGEKNARLV
jgi:hypothetical protein